LRIYNPDNLNFDKTILKNGFSATTNRRIRILFTPVTTAFKLRLELVGSGDITLDSLKVTEIGVKRDVLVDGFEDSPTFGNNFASGTTVISGGFFVKNAAPAQHTFSQSEMARGGYTDGIITHDNYWMANFQAPFAFPDEFQEMSIYPYDPEVSSDTGDGGLEPRFKTIKFNDPVSTLKKSDFHWSGVLNRSESTIISLNNLAFGNLVFMKKIVPSDFTSLTALEFPSGEDGFSFITISSEPSEWNIGNPITSLAVDVYSYFQTLRSTTAFISLMNTKS